MIPKLPRIVTDIPVIDDWVEKITTAVEMCMNVTASGGLSVKVGPNGINFTGKPLRVEWAKSGGSGIAAQSTDEVELYDFDGSTHTAQDVMVDAYNPSSEDVGADKLLILWQIGLYWVVVWEDCDE